MILAAHACASLALLPLLLLLLLLPSRRSAAARVGTNGNSVSIGVWGIQMRVTSRATVLLPLK